MGYLYLMIVALMFSFGGTCVKLIRPYFTPSMITFMRFFVGVFWLLMLKALRRRRFRPDFAAAFRRRWKWLAFGAAAKLLAYTTENTALSIGVSYGNILTQPVQIVLLTGLGVAVLHERMSARKWTGVALCVSGILLISWNGMPLETLLAGNLTLTLLYVLSGICAGLFVFAQKRVSKDFDILDSNLVMFAAAAALAFILPAARGEALPSGLPDWRCVLAILGFGLITGIGFYFNAKAIPLVPFQMVPLLQSTMVFFSIAWGVVLFHEPVSAWIVSGTALFVAGIVMMQRPGRGRAAKEEK
ncbi:MAG: DMT family transporter [Clostridia bacterium]|nr:DMT family transporter [Clostridia bacterium]